jgi:hypothetical protein
MERTTSSPFRQAWSTAQDITIAMWVDWDGGTNWQRIFDFGNGPGEYLYLSPKSGSNTLRFAIVNNGTEQQLNTTPLVAGQWTHLAVTLGSGTGRAIRERNAG